MGKMSIKERREIYKQIKEITNRPCVSIREANHCQYLWDQLAHGMWRNISNDLNHVGNYPLIDSFQGDVMDRSEPTLQEIIEHFDAEELEILQSNMNYALQGMRYLNDTLKQEKQKRGSRAIIKPFQ